MLLIYYELSLVLTVLPPSDRLCLARRHMRPRFRALPWPSITPLGYPPALTRQTVALAHNQHRQLGIAAPAAARVHLAEHDTKLPHQWPRKPMAERGERFRVSERLPSPRRADQQRFHLVDIESHAAPFDRASDDPQALVG